MPYLTNTFTGLNLFEKLIRDAHMKVLNVCCNVALFMIVKLRNKVSNKRENGQRYGTYILWKTMKILRGYF